MCWAWTHINTGLSMEYGPFDIVATARRVGAAVTGVPAGGLSFVAKKHLAVPNRQRPQGQEHINLLLTLASTVGIPGSTGIDYVSSLVDDNPGIIVDNVWGIGRKPYTHNRM